MELDEPLNPVEVEQEMRDLGGRLEAAPGIIKARYEALRVAKREFKLAHAIAYQSAVGTQGDRKAAADIATEQLQANLDVAEVAYKHAVEQLSALKAKLRALQSVSSLMKASMFNQ